MGNTLEITDANFEEVVLRADKPVLVDFWAAWCGPCKLIAPTVELLSEEFAGKAYVGKLDVDNNDITPTQFGVRNIPTLLIIKNGEVVDKIVGNVPKNILESKLAHWS